MEFTHNLCTSYMFYPKKHLFKLQDQYLNSLPGLKCPRSQCTYLWICRAFATAQVNQQTPSTAMGHDQTTS